MECRPVVGSFLCLPAEIRLRIYTLIVPSGHRFLIEDIEGFIYGLTFPDQEFDWKYFIHTRQEMTTTWALLQVHSTCRREVSPLLYGGNVFDDCMMPRRALGWLRHIGLRNASTIRHFRTAFAAEGGTERAAKNLFRSLVQRLPSLRRIEVLDVTNGGKVGDALTGLDLSRARHVASQVPQLKYVYRKKRGNYNNSLTFVSYETSTYVSSPLPARHIII